ncbi:MAG: hypothetical protein QJT81_08005 [Candidatus Thiothrix putei]|uniref:Uncharacterized protein n=1 Tax=Candidatus Thiothrix putei TaxID=3080811 RepID=A0AA95KRZ6_9GAMM|nr:MAG: hypothetical protein QJT81_08005 [Candidatus Thiothrix putei]
MLPSPLAGEGLGMGDKAQPFDDNLLIHGDNLLALKALEQQYAGKVKNARNARNGSEPSLLLGKKWQIRNTHAKTF